MKEVYEALVELYKFYDTINASTSTPSHFRQAQASDEFDVERLYDLGNFFFFFLVLCYCVFM